MSRRSEILEAMRDRISAIDSIDEKQVLVGRLPRLGQDDPEVGVAIMPGGDFPDEELQRSYRRWEIEVTRARAQGRLDRFRGNVV